MWLPPEAHAHPPNWGGSAVFTFAGQREQLAQVALKPEYGTGLVVTLHPPERVLSPPTSQHVDQSFARIFFGAGGARAQVEVDWRQGSVFCLHTSQLSIEGVTPTNPIVDPPGFPDLRLGCHIAPGERPPLGNRGPTRTVFYPDIAPVSIVVLPIPRFARSVTIVKLLTISDAWSIDFRQGTGVLALSSIDYSNSAVRSVGFIGQEVAVPADATFLAITNSSSASTMLHVEAIYQLAL